MNDERIHLFEDFTLDAARGCLLRAGEPVHLRPQSYEVLKYLTENLGRLVSKDNLIKAVWRGRAVTDDALVQCLMEVRHALGAQGKLYVRNVRGRGYIFDLEAGDRQIGGGSIRTAEVDLLRVVVEDEEEMVRSGEIDHTPPQPANLTARPAGPLTAAEASVSHPASSAEHVVSNAGRRSRLALVLTSLVFAAAVTAFAYFKYSSSRSQTITSIAVLSFANASADQDMEYLSDGLSESLINSLSQLPQLKVIARSSAFKYKGEEADPKDVARALGVQAILTGRVAQRGDSLVVSAELVDARDRTQVWGEQYSRKAGDIQAVQEEMARTISEKLRLHLSGAQEQRFTKHATQNSQAYQFYLNGLFYHRKRGSENVRKALDYFNQAVALDPNFALAWVGVAYANRYFSGNSLLDPKEPLARAKLATRKALDLDETLAEAHVQLAGIRQEEWDWTGAEREYKRAIELNSNLVEAHTWYSGLLSVMGRHAEAMAENQRAQELDPLETGFRAREAWLLHLARRHDEASEKLQQLIKTEPNGSSTRHNTLGLTYAAKGMYEQAINEYRKGVSINETWAQIILGYALAMSGKRSEAQAIIDELEKRKGYVSPAELAILYVGLGDKEGAIALLERAYAAHDLQLQFLKVDPHYDSLRSDARFQDLLHRVGLPQ